MKLRKNVIASVVCVLIAVISVVLWTQLRHRNDAEWIVVYGNVDIREVDLGFRVFGKVEKLYVDEGDHVKEGDLLAELDNGPYADALSGAQASVEAVKVSLANAAKQFLRRTQAVQTCAVSEEDFENALSQEKELQANLKEAEASLSIAKTRYDDTKLFAPSSGTILTRIREPGSVLNPGEPVFSLSLEDPIWIRTYVSEPDLGAIHPGMAAEVITDTPKNPIYHGHIGFISPVAEFTPKNVETTDLRTELVYRIRVVIDHPDPGLRQGMPVTVKIKR